jgi:hypothetical protein
MERTTTMQSVDQFIASEAEKLGISHEEMLEQTRRYVEYKADEAELFRLLAESKKALKEGRFRPAKEFFDELKRDMENGTL